MAVHKFFPMFVDLNDKKAVVIGAGKIALRRINTLLKFCSDITVIADRAEKEVHLLAESGVIKLYCRNYEHGDCKGADIVLTAADNREVNHAVFEECRELGVAVNVSDCKEECSFYFPAVIDDDNVVIGVTASGFDHRRAKNTAENIRKLKNEIFNTES